MEYKWVCSIVTLYENWHWNPCNIAKRAINEKYQKKKFKTLIFSLENQTHED